MDRAYGQIIAAVEKYSDCEAELREIYPQHWAELSGNKDVPLDPAYPVYRFLDEQGAVFLVTLRDAGRLVGYFLGFLFPELHYQHVKACIGDIFYVLPGYRTGNAGLKLFRFAEQELRRSGVGRWHVTTKIAQDCGALFRRIGFKPVEVYYQKRLS